MTAAGLVGTWVVDNLATAETGQVTFSGDGTYTIDSGSYEAGGSWISEMSGTYQVFPGDAIGFTYDSVPPPSGFPVNRVALVRCATADEIIHVTAGHTHALEVLTRLP